MISSAIELSANEINQIAGGNHICDFYISDNPCFRTMSCFYPKIDGTGQTDRVATGESSLCPLLVTGLKLSSINLSQIKISTDDHLFKVFELISGSIDGITICVGKNICQ